VRKPLLVAILISVAASASADEIPNRLIDYDAFKTGVTQVQQLREQRRITEAQFLRMSKDPATVILDARSAEKFAMLHVKGAKNLSLPDITEEELAKILPSKSTRVLIYCNNNFLNEPRAFPTKAPAASLNVHTLNVLHTYGYENVYELGPLLDVRSTRIRFEGREAGSRAR
jgi:phage shock protein E